MITFTASPASRLQGEIRVPGDKSISHRSIIFGSIAQGRTEISGFLEGEDSLRTLQAFRDMGVQIERPGAGQVVIEGVGLHGLQQPEKPIDLGNSGTAMRLMTGLLAGQKFSSQVTGDESLSARPMARIITPLGKMGAVIDSAPDHRPPLTIAGQTNAARLAGIEYQTPVASAQIKSCLLLAGLYADGITTVVEPGVTRDHTERMLKGFGVPVDSAYPRAAIQGDCELTATNIAVPSDISSATFFMVGACISKDSDILLKDVGMNPTRDGIVKILKLMGADIALSNHQEIGGEPVADIRVRSSELKGIEVPEDLVPLAIDEFPAIFVAASAADGVTTVTGAEELRVKETDRIKAMVDGLSILGVHIVDKPDGAVIEGRAGHPTPLAGGAVDSCGDHRIAMSLAMASLLCEAPVVISDCANVNTSFPGFAELANSTGLNISTSQTPSADGSEKS